MEMRATGVRQRSYTEEYKRQIADLVVGTGRTATAVAAEVGVHLLSWLSSCGRRAYCIYVLWSRNRWRRLRVGAGRTHFPADVPRKLTKQMLAAGVPV